MKSYLLLPLALLVVVLSSRVAKGDNKVAADVNYYFPSPPPRPLSDASEAPRKIMRLAGGWRPIENVADPHVVEISKFAVSEHNRQAEDQLVFVRVVKGESQVTAGINYRLVIETKDGSNVENYEAVVWVKEWEKFMQLTSFKSISN